MVKVSGPIELNTQTMKATTSLFADAKSDVTAQMTVVGLPEGYTLDAGCDVMTAKGEVAFMKSDGTWNWVG